MAVVGELVRHRVSFIAENAFRVGDDLPGAADAQVNWLQIRCAAEPGVLMKRFRRRALNGTRHPVHVDKAREAEIERLIAEPHWGYLNLPGDRITVETDDFESVSYRDSCASILSRARHLL